MAERLWNPFIASWYEGRDDPKLRLLKLDLEYAHVWLNENSLLAGVKMMPGGDPKKDYQDKTADIQLQAQVRPARYGLQPVSAASIRVTASRT